MDDNFWEDFILQSTRTWGNIAGAVLTDQPYYSPDDPRFGQATVTMSRPVANYDPNIGRGNAPLAPPYGFPNAGGNLGVNANRAGLGINIPDWAIYGGALIGLVYILGGKKGR